MFSTKDGKFEIRVSGRWHSVPGSREPVRRTTGRFIQTVRLAAGLDGRGRVPVKVGARRYIPLKLTGPRSLAGHILADLAPWATRSHLQSPSLDSVFVTRAGERSVTCIAIQPERRHGLLPAESSCARPRQSNRGKAAGLHQNFSMKSPGPKLGTVAICTSVGAGISQECPRR
jgi:hypothetical protein